MMKKLLPVLLLPTLVLAQPPQGQPSQGQMPPPPPFGEFKKNTAQKNFFAALALVLAFITLFAVPAG